MSHPFIPVVIGKLPDPTPVVINEGLIARWQQLKSGGQFIIGEIGFSNAVNFLNCWQLWLQHAPSDAQLIFFSNEVNPLSARDLAECLKTYPQFSDLSARLLAKYPVLTPGFHHLDFADGRIRLTLMLGEAVACFNELHLCGDHVLEKQLRNHYIDTWLINGNFPAGLEKSFQLLSKQGTTLYSSESINSTLSGSDTLYKGRKTPWHVYLKKPSKDKHAIIIGAGLGGCFTAQALAKRGWKITLLDAGGEVASGASGNNQAVLYPKLSAFSSPLTAFMLSAYLYAHQIYKNIPTDYCIAELEGIVQLNYSHREAIAQRSMGAWLNAYPELGRLVTIEQILELTGVEVEKDGLFLPLSGWINCQALCHYLIDHPLINFIPHQSISRLENINGLWHVNNHRAETVVITNGYKANQFSQTAHLPLKAIPGQITYVAATLASSKLKIPLCGAGHILPVRQNSHALGATYHQGINSLINTQQDDLINLAKMGELSTSFAKNNAIIDNWQGIRAATPDYLPLVGSVADEEGFLRRFAGLSSNSKRWLPYAGDFYDGLYICAGFGSRGLTTAPLCSEWLASLINDEPSCLPESFIRALSPARFLIKSIIKKSNHSPQSAAARPIAVMKSEAA